MAHSMPTTGVLVKQLDFALVKSIEFSLGNSDAKCTGYYRGKLRIRFYMNVYIGNRLFHCCTVRCYNTGLQQSRYWRGCLGANIPLC